nr:hypothetical protein [Tanacetum cinerariifolium]
GENQVVSKSSAVTTDDASDKRQQQHDLTSSTLTLATTITADGNFDLKKQGSKALKRNLSSWLMQMLMKKLRVKVNCTSHDTLQQASTTRTQSDNAPVYDSDGSTEISFDKAYNDMQQKIKWLQAQLGYLKGKSSDTQCASNTLDPLS